MKKMFPSDESYSRIDKINIDNETRNNMKGNKLFKVMAISLSCFVVGVAVTGFVIYASLKEPKVSGVGGLETSGITEFNSLNTNAGIKDSYLSSDTVNEFSFLNDSSAFDVNGDFSENLLYENDNDDSVTYQTYRVQPGDMIGVIADKYDVTQDTIISVNNIKQSRLIQPGQYLKIPSMPGIIYNVREDGETIKSISESYEVNAEKCAYVNGLNPSDVLSSGVSLFIPDAELDWTTRQEINGDLFKKPLHCRYWLSSPYGWRDSPFNPGKRTFHGGIDMAANMGNKVYPAMDGEVVETGYNNVYGNYVIISHHSGYSTLYGHLSSINCKPKNFVYTNTVIGRVGSTGMSTGPHLHFTVYKNGKTVNPSLLLN